MSWDSDLALHGPLVGLADGRTRLNTPALVVELDALDRNIARMAAFAAAHGVKLRPHAKTHKSVDIGRRQVEAGAVGLCCAKLGEAEALADGGLDGLHVTSPVVTPPAVARLLALHARTTDLSVVADHPDNVAALGAAARACDRPLRVMVDVDPGIRRTGVSSPEAAVALRRAIDAEPGLVFAGVQFYCGAQQHIEDFAARREAVLDRLAYLRRVLEAVAEAGGPAPIVTGGGTGSHRIDVESGLFTELQVGSYVFMDAQYLDCALAQDEAQPFETSLVVDARVISANAGPLVTVDAGFKAFSTDAGPPRITEGAPEGAGYAFMGDEHGAVILPSGANDRPHLGGRVTLGAPHCDPTVNLYDTYHVVRGEELVALWPVSGRGRSR